MAFVYIKEQTPELCLAAVQQNGLALQFVKFKEQTPELCLAAVKQYRLALQFVKDHKLKEKIKIEIILLKH